MDTVKVYIPAAVGPAGAITQPNTGLEFLEHWMTAQTAGRSGWSQVASGAGAAAAIDAAPIVTPTHPGVVAMATGTTTLGACALHLGTPFILAGGSLVLEKMIQFDTLSSATDEFTSHLGLGDIFTAEFQNGVYFTYDRAGAGLNFQCKCAKAGIRTVVDSAVAVIAGQFFKLRIVINGAGTQAQFYINGTLVATIITNLPVVQVGPAMGIFKSAGTNSRAVHADYFYSKFLLNTPL